MILLKQYICVDRWRHHFLLNIRRVCFIGVSSSMANVCAVMINPPTQSYSERCKQSGHQWVCVCVWLTWLSMQHNQQATRSECPINFNHHHALANKRPRLPLLFSLYLVARPNPHPLSPSVLYSPCSLALSFVSCLPSIVSLNKTLYRLTWLPPFPFRSLCNLSALSLISHFDFYLSDSLHNPLLLSLSLFLAKPQYSCVVSHWERSMLSFILLRS